MKQYKIFLASALCIASFAVGCGGDDGKRKCDPATDLSYCKDANTLTQCVAGEFTDQGCEYGCDAQKTACKPKPCTKESYPDRCDASGKMLLVCKDGVPESPVTCPAGCRDDRCIDNSSCTTETLPDKCLDAKRLQQCVEGKPKIAICDEGCAQDACIHEACTRVDYPLGCDDDGNTLHYCNCGTEDNPATCFSDLQKGKKRTEPCSIRCVKGNADGETAEPDYCATCDPATSQPKCDANNPDVIITCGEDYRWKENRCLDGKGYCKDDENRCVEYCDPGDARCKGDDALEWCNQGMWDVKSCDKGCGSVTDKWGRATDTCYLCDAQYVATCVDANTRRSCVNHEIADERCEDGCDAATGECKPCVLDAHRCLRGEVQKCVYRDDLGRNVWDKDPDIDCLAQGSVCNLEDPTGCVLCNVGTKSCDGDMLRECVDDGTLHWDDANATDCAALGVDVYCDADHARCAVRPSAVGQPCVCDGPNCDARITKSQFDRILLIPLGLLGWTADDHIAFPNLWATGEKTKIYGCDALQKDLPAGMAVGCLRDGQFYMTDNAKQSLQGAKTLVCTYMQEACEFATMLVDALSADLSISVPDGYCFAGAMNVDFQFKKTELIHNALAEDGAAVAELADSMLDVGDVSAVTPQSKCPAGTVLFSGVHKKLIFDEHGDMHVNAAMCLQKCLDDGDCRADEGYSCIQWRDQNVCFHEETMQNLRKWEEEMGLVD